MRFLRTVASAALFAEGCRLRHSSSWVRQFSELYILYSSPECFQVEQSKVRKLRILRRDPERFARVPRIIGTASTPLGPLGGAVATYPARGTDPPNEICVEPP